MLMARAGRRGVGRARQVNQSRQARLRAQHLVAWANWAAARATRRAVRETAVATGTAAVDRRRRRCVFDAWCTVILAAAAGERRALARSMHRWHAAAAAAASRRALGAQMARRVQRRVRRTVFAALVRYSCYSARLNRLFDALVVFRSRRLLHGWRDALTHAREARARFRMRLMAADVHAGQRARSHAAARLRAWRAVVTHAREARARFRVRVMAASHYTAKLQRAGLDAFAAQRVARQLTVSAGVRQRARA
jgi:hypothetical protein